MNRVERIEEHLEAIMDILDLDRTPSNVGTPNRIARMWVNEIFANRNNNNIEELDKKMKVFPLEKEVRDSEIRVVVPFISNCEHHWVTFRGDVTVSYVPDKDIIGLSKIPRVVKYFSNKPQLQEQITEEICDYLVKIIKPKSLRVEVEATHMCVEMRGVESPCVTFTRSEYTKEDDIND